MGPLKSDASWEPPTTQSLKLPAENPSGHLLSLTVNTSRQVQDRETKGFLCRLNSCSLGATLAPTPSQLSHAKALDLQQQPH